ncbi:hypothetical protein D3C87_1504350 [compost metagenome]
MNRTSNQVQRGVPTSSQNVVSKSLVRKCGLAPVVRGYPIRGLAWRLEVGPAQLRRKNHFFGHR